jgi:hypothetical protein
MPRFAPGRRDEQTHLNAGVVHFLRLGQRVLIRDRKPPSVVTSNRRSGTRQTMSGKLEAMATISGALAISRLSRVVMTSRSFQTSRS